jgi:hypothetical protein
MGECERCLEYVESVILVHNVRDEDGTLYRNICERCAHVVDQRSY